MIKTSLLTEKKDFCDLRRLNVKYNTYDKNINFYSGFDYMSELNNTFVKLFSFSGYKRKEMELNKFGIDYDRNINSVFFEIYSHIANLFNKEKLDVFNENGKPLNIDFTCYVAEINERMNYFYFNIQINNTKEIEKTPYILNRISIQIKTKLEKIIISQREYINKWINSVIIGEHYLTKEIIRINDKNEFNYFYLDFRTYLKQENNCLQIEHKIIYENPYKMEHLISYVNSIEAQINDINKILKKAYCLSSAMDFGIKNKFAKLFNEIDVSKKLNIPKCFNKNAVYDDENSVFLIDPEYKELSGNISIDTFLNLKDSFSTEHALSKFIKALKKI